MGRFKPGQKLVCVHKPSVWEATGKPSHLPSPDKGEVVTCDGYNRHGSLLLAEYAEFVFTGRLSFDDNDFRPAEYESESVIFESIPEPFTV